MRFYTIAAAAFICAGQASGQSVGKMFGDDVKHAAQDIWHVYKAPFSASGKDWAMFGGVVALSALAMPLDKPVEKWAQANDSSPVFKPIEQLRRGGWLFAGKYVVPPAVGLYAIGLATKNQNLRDGVIGCAASWGGQSPPRKLLYRIIGRQRPETSPDDNQSWRIPNRTESGEDSWQWHSMPSGHFANAVGCASFLANRFDMHGWEALVYAIAAGVGIGRSLDHAHWMSDHVIGGAFGYAVGKEVARRSLNRKLASSSPSMTASPNERGYTFNLSWRF